MADDIKNLFDGYVATGGKLVDSAAPKDEFLKFLETKSAASGKSLDKAILEKLVNTIDANSDGSITPAEVDAIQKVQISDAVQLLSANTPSQTLKETVQGVLAVIAPVRYLQGKLIEETQKNAYYIAGKSLEGGDISKWVSENGGKTVATWAMENGLGNAIDATRDLVNGKENPISTAWQKDKGTVLGIGGALLGLVAMLFGGGGPMMLFLLPLLGFIGGEAMDGENGIFGGHGLFGGGKGNASGLAQGQSQGQGQEASANQAASTPKKLTEGDLYTQRINDGKGDMLVNGQVVNGEFQISGVSVIPASGRPDLNENGQVIFTPIMKNKQNNYTLPIKDGVVVMDNVATLTPILRGAGEIDNNIAEARDAQKYSENPALMLLDKQSRSDVEALKFALTTGGADHKVHNYQVIANKAANSDDLKIVSVAEYSANGQTTSPVNLASFTIKDADIPDKGKFERGSDLADSLAQQVAGAKIADLSAKVKQQATRNTTFPVTDAPNIECSVYNKAACTPAKISVLNR